MGICQRGFWILRWRYMLKGVIVNLDNNISDKNYQNSLVLLLPFHACVQKKKII